MTVSAADCTGAEVMEESMTAKLSGPAAVALSAAARDPEIGSVPVRKGWTADVVESDAGVRRLSLRNGSEEQVSLRRSPAAELRPESYPAELPFVRAVTVWWGRSEEALLAAWTGSADVDGVMASVVAECSSQGWTVNSTLLLERPFPRVTALTHAGRRRVVMEQEGAVMLVETLIEGRAR